MRIGRGIHRRRMPAVDGAYDPIKHVIVLMLENRSFDQMLGCLTAIYPEMVGVDTTALRWNCDQFNRLYYQRQSNDPVVDPDPKHDREHVAIQLADNNG